MKTWFSLLGLLLVLLSLNACGDGIEERLLIGKWQAIELAEKKEPVDLDLSPVFFEFFPDKKYHFQSTLKFSESGNYYTQGQLLYTTDTTSSEVLEKAVKIIQLSSDSLGFLMNANGIEKQLRLVRIRN